ncbi:MAG: hypothetical protein A3I11_05275 [Elusimicrobia bacterium RIFCSPLOWO2_02_FULL_39_32]|nr:MAG: hypothetical protein A2034_02050 [Elusimicrobia bacterium GWA2_38_7]OGR80044.1 MAG: hypothetical protein A3B80_00330 [Elusimicrobia bacterium RIFCSPHIGHO2_02_FULL_39_36]OGR91160.1 MAG: hypothetical protein A3I11_05275 [Elusimicrobia bacterium RIFCSPLOWO2_02_FULL_39_32]OGS00128.1 MAG: hypothetical protein A3G85_08240 [Elusimicrobia bacterium RIFCSPLOWO2_12_FULL_39_28]
MFTKLFRFFWGLALIPLTLATYRHFPEFIFSLNHSLDLLFFLLLGALLYIFFEIIFNRPLRTYVFGHELTHALASVVVGGKVHSFEVSKEGGSVSLSKTNFFVALSPYCIPFYTLFIFLVYTILGFWIEMEKYHLIFLALIGFTLAFHLSLTIFAIRQEQPDIKKTGFIFSLVFILLVNAWILVFLTKFLFWDSVGVKRYFFQVFNTHSLIWAWVWEKGIEFYKLGIRKF